MRVNQSLALLVAPVLVLSGLATAHAAPRSPTANATKQAGHSIVKELRTTLALLAESDHDYQGHRAAAMHKIREAIRGIEQHHAKTGQQGQQGQAGLKKTTGEVPQGQGAAKEPLTQAQSDANLNTAIGQLQSVQMQIGSSHPQVSGDITAAIGELQTALKIK
jgi:hypothetical protein